MANAWQASCTAGIYAYNSIPAAPHPMTQLLQDKYVFCRSLLAPLSLFQLSLPATDTEGRKNSTEHACLFLSFNFLCRMES
jgi:hypothetical protein